MRILITLLVLTLLPCLTNGHPQDWTRVHDVTMRGINLLYNLEMERARETFDTVIALAPGDPRGRFFKSMTHFWTYTLKNDERHFDTFMAQSDTVIDICEGLLDRNPKDAVSMFYLGGIRGYRGMAQQLNGSLLQAVVEGRAGYTHLEDAVRLRPDLSDAQMGFGIFRYLTAKIPRGQSWIISLLGFEADAEGGLQSLRLAADRGVYTRSEASFYLAQFLFNEQKQEEAFSRMAWLRAHHPENTLFHVLAASWHFRLNNYDSALAALRWAAVINDRKAIKYGEEFIYSTRGSIQFTRNNFDAARRDFDVFLVKLAQRDRIPNYTLYRIALAREIAGDRKGAVDACTMARESSGGDRGRDSYQIRKLRELAARPLTAAEILLVKANNASSRKDVDSSITYYAAALAASGSDGDVKARALYGLQQINFDRGDFEGAIADGQQAVAIATPRETWVAPQAYLKLAQSFAKLGRKKEALDALRKIEEFDDYDFQKSVEERAEEERENIEKEK